MSDSGTPFDSPPAKTTDASPAARGVRIQWIINSLCLVGIVLILIGFSLPSVTFVKPTARTLSSQAQLKLIALALRNYHDVHGSFPPAYVTGPTGEPLYSWRVLILPHLKQQVLYDAFLLDQPWDSPQNLRLLRQMPEEYLSPFQDYAPEKGLTAYQVPVSKGELKTFLLPKRGRIMADVVDGPSNTAVVVEDLNHLVLWTKPDDLGAEEFLRGLAQKEFVHLVLGDGRVQQILKPNREGLLPLIYANDGKVPSE